MLNVRFIRYVFKGGLLDRTDYIAWDPDTGKEEVHSAWPPKYEIGPYCMKQIRGYEYSSDLAKQFDGEYTYKLREVMSREERVLERCPDMAVTVAIH